MTEPVRLPIAGLVVELPDGSRVPIKDLVVLVPAGAVSADLGTLHHVVAVGGPGIAQPPQTEPTP